MVDPILKWVGGKRQLMEELKALLPDEYNQYHEPFVGGGALFANLNPDSGSINDKNIRLMNYYEVVKSHPEELISELENFSGPESDPDPYRRFSESTQKGKEVTEYYYQQRALFNLRPYNDVYDPIKEASLLQYLNRTCYNGLYRENQSGGFNSPIGSYDNPEWVFPDRINTFSTALEGIDIYSKDFSYIIERAEENDLVYFDPPYKPVSETESFTEYSKDGFDQEDQLRLLDVIQELTENGVYVIVSNSGVLKDKYSETLSVSTVDATRSINSDGQNRGSVEEIIATNY